VPRSRHPQGRVYTLMYSNIVSEECRPQRGSASRCSNPHAAIARGSSRRADAEVRSAPPARGAPKMQGAGKQGSSLAATTARCSASQSVPGTGMCGCVLAAECPGQGRWRELPTVCLMARWGGSTWAIAPDANQPERGHGGDADVSHLRLLKARGAPQPCRKR
jgi:hypothetical protein